MMPKDENKGSVKPTIVGGQPSDHKSRAGGVPRGMEALIKKAAVDPEFRQMLLEKRADAASEIDLELTDVEAGMLNSIPHAQTEQIVDKTTVPKEHRRVFLGKVGAAMLAVLGLELTACLPVVYTGNRPGGYGPSPAELKIPTGISPDDPSELRNSKPEAKINDKKQLLNVKTNNTGRDSVSVPVKYDCPFEKATLKIFFADKDKKEAEDVLCRPHLVLVSKGMGKTKFQGSAKRGTTEWILVRLSDSDEKCRDEDPISITDLLNEDAPQEYLVGKCSVWRIVKFLKKWKA
jgi:hypothetical protein